MKLDNDPSQTNMNVVELDGKKVVVGEELEGWPMTEE
jgi:hypothetical protein